MKQEITKNSVLWWRPFQRNASNPRGLKFLIMAMLFGLGATSAFGQFIVERNGQTLKTCSNALTAVYESAQRLDSEAKSGNTVIYARHNSTKTYFCFHGENFSKQTTSQSEANQWLNGFLETYVFCSDGIVYGARTDGKNNPHITTEPDMESGYTYVYKWSELRNDWQSMTATLDLSQCKYNTPGAWRQYPGNNIYIYGQLRHNGSGNFGGMEDWGFLKGPGDTKWRFIAPGYPETGGFTIDMNAVANLEWKLEDNNNRFAFYVNGQLIYSKSCNVSTMRQNNMRFLMATTMCPDYGESSLNAKAEDRISDFRDGTFFGPVKWKDCQLKRTNGVVWNFWLDDSQQSIYCSQLMTQVLQPNSSQNPTNSEIITLSRTGSFTPPTTISNSIIINTYQVIYTKGEPIYVWGSTAGVGYTSTDFYLKDNDIPGTSSLDWKMGLTSTSPNHTFSTSTLNPGTYYVYMVSHFDNAPDVKESKMITIRAQDTPPPTPPANDQCSNAIPLTCGNTMSGTLAGATRSSSVTYSDYSDKKDVFYFFTPINSGEYTITLNNFSNDKDLFLYSNCNTQEKLTSSAGNTSTETIKYTLTANMPYRIRIVDYSGTEGTFNIKVECPTQHIITFNAQGGSVTPNNITVYQGAEVGTLPTPTLDNYTFGGWWTEQDGKGTQYTAYTTYNATNNITLFAKWVANQAGQTWNIGYPTETNVTANLNNGVLTISGTGETKNMGSGSSIIHAPWFQQYDNITKVIITNEVTKIGDYLFHSLSALTSVTIPTSVTTIGNSAFYDCSSLPSITIPNTVTSIGSGAFQSCTSLTSITIPSSISSISDYTFSGCGLTSINIPNSVTSIGESAFSGCKFSTLTIPNSVTTIGNSAFSGCNNLTSLPIPNSVTVINNHVFMSCEGLTSITIPDWVTTIGASAFSYCSNLTSVTIPNSVTSIGSEAFRRTALKDVTVNWETPLSAYNVFAYMNLSNTNLHVPIGTQCKYATVSPWKDFNIVKDLQTINFPEIPTKTYGDAPLTLSATSTSGLAVKLSSSNSAVATISGNTLTIKGTGTTDITATQVGDCAYIAANQVVRTFTVEKAPLTVTAENKIRKQWQKNPQFTLDYSGFKNNETVNVLDVLPTIFCAANENSLAGFYDIIPSGGSDNNYEYIFINGRLEVTETTDIETIDENSLIVYPNPTTGIVNISETAEIKVYNSFGALLFTTFGSQVDLSNYANGVYFVQVNGERIKVIKQ